MSLSLSHNLEERYLLSLAREEVEYLRRLYGKATDALGKVGDLQATEYGAATFHRIFTPDVCSKSNWRAQGVRGFWPR